MQDDWPPGAGVSFLKGSTMSNTDAVGVQGAVEEFLQAFDALDWERFRQCFAPEAMVFFPFDSQPRRAQGSEAVEAVFKRFFDEVRTHAAGPPYLHLTPHDLTIQVWQDIALVTFHLDRTSGVGRRTVVMQRQAQQWRIIHLHASNITEPRSAGAAPG